MADEPITPRSIADGHLDQVAVVAAHVHRVREIFTSMPTATDEDWAAVAGRLRNVRGWFADFVADGSERLRPELDAAAGRATVAVAEFRGWLRGLDAAKRRHGAAFDPKAWHMKALSQGSLGLDDLADSLASL